MIEKTFPIENTKSLLALFGTQDQHLKSIREQLSVDISTQPGGLLLRGAVQAVEQAESALLQMKLRVKQGKTLKKDDVSNILSRVCGTDVEDGALNAIEVFTANRAIRPKTAGQRVLVKAIEQSELTFCTGPAGTGKTFLAVAMAVSHLKRGLIRKIVLARPAVEAGESLGFLPGDLQAKINPYLRPLLDALSEMMDFDQIKRYTEQDLIEMIPLAYMRGRTLNEAFIILDEAQNTTISQMKMFLTRMGMGSKIVVSGDVTQTDLPSHKQSGLMDATQRLREIEGMAVVQMTDADVVRHRLVQEIIRAYDE